MTDQQTTTQRVLFALATVFFLLRYLWPGDTIYILDEAYVQLVVDKALAAGTIPLSNSRGSSIPLPYGPGGPLFYMVVRQFTWNPVYIALAHITLQISGSLIFLRAVARAYGREACAWIALAVATSPFLFFSARHSWDNTMIIPVAGFIVYLLQKLRDGGPEILLHALLGYAGGYALATHLMFGPVMLALGLTLVLWNLRKHSLRRPRAWVLLFAFGLGAAVILGPYLWEAFRIAREEKALEHTRTTHRWGDGRNLWWTFLRTTLFSSLFGARAMLDDVRTQFFAFTGQPFAFFYRIDLFGWFGKLAAWGAAGAVLFRLVRLRFDDEPLRIFSALSFFFLVLVFQYLNIPTAQHYYQPIWWFVFLGIALAIHTLRPPWKQAFLAVTAACLFVNGSYIAFAMAYIHQNKGARNMDTSVAVSEQMRNVRELCAWAKAHGKSEVKIFKDAFLGEPTLEFLPKHMPECQGITLPLVANKPEADFVLHHPADSETSAALVAEPVKP